MSRTVEIQQQRDAQHSVQLALGLLPVAALLLGIGMGALLTAGVVNTGLTVGLLALCVGILLCGIAYYQKRLKSLLGAR